MIPRAASVTLMIAKSLLTLTALSLVVGCSSSENQGTPGAAGSAGLGASGAAGTPASGGGTSDDPLVVPATLTVAPHAGNNSVFQVTALTLRQGAGGAELYAAVKNVGSIAGCNVSFSVSLFDKDGGTVGNGISGLMVRRYFAGTDDSVAVAGCVSPGDVTMVAITDLYLEIPIEDVRSLDYMSQYWSLTKVVPIAGVSLTGVEAVTLGSGVAYRGTLVNGLDTELTGPTVAVFPLDARGRPLGVAYGGSSKSSVTVPPSGTWDFETAATDDAGVGFDAYPMGGP